MGEEREKVEMLLTSGDSSAQVGAGVYVFTEQQQAPLPVSYVVPPVTAMTTATVGGQPAVSDGGQRQQGFSSEKGAERSRQAGDGSGARGSSSAASGSAHQS